MSCMDHGQTRDNIDQVPSPVDISENGYDSDAWTKTSSPGGGPTPARRPQESARPMDLQELASKAVSHALARNEPVRRPTEMVREPSREKSQLSLALREMIPRRDGPATSAPPLRNITLPPRDFYPPGDSFSPRQPNGPSMPLTSPRSHDARSPTSSLPASESELPPLHSPSHGVSWLPSVKELMISEPRPLTPGREDQQPLTLHNATFPPSLAGLGPVPPPVPPLRPSSFSGPHGTSPISQDGAHPDLPSPIRPPGSYYYSSPNMSNDGNSLSRPPNDFHGSNGPESPNDSSAPSQAEQSAANDGTSETGTYKCTFEGCLARPFQTQYLLNSHANVHSVERPHYCPVPNCPRSKTGQGFKRKNEMIRHGFVHKSPGYACPFCPDREHKYPRPDNLQR